MQGNPVFMEKAIALATENVTLGRGGPFGAVIVRDGEILATGANSVTATNDPTAHGEIVAIRNACIALGSFQLCGCHIYTSCPKEFPVILCDPATGGHEGNKFYEANWQFFMSF